MNSFRNMNSGTIQQQKYLANFKKIVLRCLKNGWLQKDPLLGFNIAKREVEGTALSDRELEKLSNIRISIERLEIVRNIFLFSCYSGLAYADVPRLKRSEIADSIDGEK